MSSKIKVDTIENVAGSGNVSLGSGHNLVVPGNITGQGTAAITSNATVGGTLGVTGVTTLSSTLSATKISAGTTDNPNSSPLYIRCATDDNIRFGQETHAAIGAVNNAANAFVDLKIDASQLSLNSQSTGAVLMPQQPLAVAYYNASTQHGAYNAGSNRSNVVCKPGATFINIGSMYDTSTGRFTVPVAGRYRAEFTGSQYSQNVSSYFVVRIQKNGTVEKDVYQSKLGTWFHLGASHVFNCAANDYIEFVTKPDFNAAGDRGGFDVNLYTNFTVYLLG